MKQKNRPRRAWESASSDRDLVFAAIGLLSLLLNFSVGLAGIQTNSILWWTIQGTGIFLLVSGIAHFVRKHYLQVNQLSVKHLPLMFVIGKSRDHSSKAYSSAQEAITGLTGFHAFLQVEKESNIKLENLITLETKRLPPDSHQWNNYVEEARQNIHRLSESVHGNSVYHVFIGGPAAMSLALGSAIGVKCRAVVYQWTDNYYKPVLNLMNNVRGIKQIMPETDFQYIKVTWPDKLTPETAVVLDNASHSALGDVSNFLKKHDMKIATVNVENTYSGNLTEDDWIPAVRELNSVFHELQSSTETTRFHLFLAMPVAMAFGLGMALGHFVSITVYNWEPDPDPGTYYPVLKLNEIKTFI